MQMHTQTHTSTNTVSLAQTWTHKLSLRQTQSTAAWSVRGGSAAGDYQVDECECLHCDSFNQVLLFPLTIAHTW